MSSIKTKTKLGGWLDLAFCVVLDVKANMAINKKVEIKTEIDFISDLVYIDLFQ